LFSFAAALLHRVAAHVKVMRLNLRSFSGNRRVRMDGGVRLGKMQMASVSQNGGAAGGWALMTNQNPAPDGGIMSCRDPEVRRNPVARGVSAHPDPARQQIDPLVVKRQGGGAVFNVKSDPPMFVRGISRPELVKLSIQFWVYAQTAIEVG
jgi:hypothetical protein